MHRQFSNEHRAQTLLTPESLNDAQQPGLDATLILEALPSLIFTD